MLGDAVGRLLGGDEKEGLGAGERRAEGLRVGVAARRLGHLGPLEPRRPAGVADHQPLLDPALGERPRDPPADRSGRAGDREGGHRAQRAPEAPAAAEASRSAVAAVRFGSPTTVLSPPAEPPASANDWRTTGLRVARTSSRRRTGVE